MMFMRSITCAFILLCGCAAHAGPVFTPDVLYWAQHTVRSNAGGYIVVYSRPDHPETGRRPLPLNERFTLNVHVFEGDGPAALEHRATDLKLNVDAAMPEHMHGMNVRPTVTQNPNGSFTVDGMLLHMPGRWEIYFDVKRRGVTERAQIELFLE